MTIELPPLKDLATDKPAILARAAQALPGVHSAAREPLARARIAAFRALEEHVTRNLTHLIEPELQSALDNHELIEGERGEADDVATWDAALDAAVLGALAPISAINVEGFRKFALGVRLDEVGRVHDVAETLAGFAAHAPEYSKPLEDAGKLLAVVGIVAADLKALAALVPDEPTGGAQPAAAAAPAPTPIAAAPPPPGPIETIEHVGEAIDRRPPPSLDELKQAYALMYQAAGPDAAEMAIRLRVSRNTFVNWCRGTTPPKCSAKDAQFLQTYCDKAAGDLRVAAEIFARVR